MVQCFPRRTLHIHKKIREINQSENYRLSGTFLREREIRSYSCKIILAILRLRATIVTAGSEAVPGGKIYNKEHTRLLMRWRGAILQIYTTADWHFLARWILLKSNPAQYYIYKRTCWWVKCWCKNSPRSISSFCGNYGIPQALVMCSICNLCTLMQLTRKWKPKFNLQNIDLSSKYSTQNKNSQSRNVKGFTHTWDK